MAAEGAVINSIGQVAECMARVLGNHLEAGVVQGLIEQVLLTYSKCLPTTTSQAAAAAGAAPAGSECQARAAAAVSQAAA